MSLIVYLTRCMNNVGHGQGQLANCDSDYDGDYDQYSCNNKAAMRGVAAFASIIWVLQVCRSVPSPELRQLS